MLVIRLSRVGKRKHPTYRIVVQEKTKAPSSSVLEFIGHYDPHTDPGTVTVREDRLTHWMGVGAQLSDTLNNLFIDRGLIKGEKRRVVQPKLKKQEGDAEAAAPAAPAAPAAEAPKAEQPAAAAATPAEAPKDEPAATA